MLFFFFGSRVLKLYFCVYKQHWNAALFFSLECGPDHHEWVLKAATEGTIFSEQQLTTRNYFCFPWWYPFTAMLNSKSVLKNKQTLPTSAFSAFCFLFLGELFLLDYFMIPEVRRTLLNLDFWNLTWFPCPNLFVLHKLSAKCLI